MHRGIAPFMHPTASLLVNSGMATIALGVAALVVAAYAWVVRRDGAGNALPLAIGLAVWIAGVALVAAAGTLRRYDVRPPPMMASLVAGFVLTFALARSRVGERLARVLPLAAIIGFQAFRLPLELVMHRAAAEGTMPVQMSFGGWNSTCSPARAPSSSPGSWPGALPRAGSSRLGP